MNNPIKILLAEDEPSLGQIIKESLETRNFEVLLCANGEEAYKVYKAENPLLLVLDVMMPKKDGFSLAEDIRKTNAEIPIVFLTAKGMTEDKVMGFKLGGDDYITKPFDNQEFLLRIKAILKRSKPTETVNNNSDVFELGSFKFEPANFMLAHTEGDQKLTKKEAEILKLLCEHKGRVLERELVANMVWGDDSYFVGRSMDVFITKLRKYLKKDPSLSITNVHGVGFRLETDI